MNELKMALIVLFILGIGINDQLNYGNDGLRTGRTFKGDGIERHYNNGSFSGRTVINGDCEINYDSNGKRTGKAITGRSGEKVHYSASGSRTGTTRQTSWGEVHYDVNGLRAGITRNRD